MTIELCSVYLLASELCRIFISFASMTLRKSIFSYSVRIILSSVDVKPFQTSSSFVKLVSFNHSSHSRISYSKMRLRRSENLWMNLIYLRIHCQRQCARNFSSTGINWVRNPVLTSSFCCIDLPKHVLINWSYPGLTKRHITSVARSIHLEQKN